LESGTVAGRRRGEGGYRGAHNLEDCVVLCAQPDESLRAILIQALLGARVVPATTGLEAIGAIETAHFNLYVLDHTLPEWSGLGLCRHIRKRDRYAPICFFTHSKAEGFRASALACGADLVVLPTSDPCELRAQLEDALKFRLMRLAASARFLDRRTATS
jgi:two-component system response regulator MprA